MKFYLPLVFTLGSILSSFAQDTQVQDDSVFVRV